MRWRSCCGSRTSSRTGSSRSQLRRQALALEQRVYEQHEDLDEARLEMLQRLARASEYRDDNTGEHTQRVGRTSALVARMLDLGAEDVKLIGHAATLHDIGKIADPGPGPAEAGPPHRRGVRADEDARARGRRDARAAAAHRCFRSPSASRSRTTSGGTAAGTSPACAATRFRCPGASWRSRTSSTRSPTTVPTSARCRSRWPSRRSAPCAAGSSTRAWWTRSKRSRTTELLDLGEFPAAA